ncbi:MULTISPECIES: CYTH domain-containing protein [unclassified Ruminococcus]|uniref:CYTH domain-containing protein n=1 Tax=unclassified Ruminococcus TaxID=2608920 RepID=UPI00210EB252|nr:MULTISPECIES: CYTH domain-containing protein [unclassified Ruminococcus]MCQ4023084.1 hypothetical protein [Ruminococcus sp. zg-924]MCQ4115521.1 hypothetical protein [Ruminococcus sp. zg-921]
MNNVPLEIERKYLIRMPSLDLLQKQNGYKDTEMLQMYLSQNSDYAGMRIRKSVMDGVVSCKRTYKRDITPLKRVEIEEDITLEEFNSLTAYRDLKYSPIHKHRHSFEYKGQTVELDIYDFWQDRATVEVEMRDEAQQVELPPFLEVIKEVTEDLRYRNRSLAKSAITEEIN